MSLPLAAVGAVLAALLESSVLPELTIAGAKPDVVLVMAVVAAMLVGVEEGLTWAFLGGLMLDLIVPERPLGATTVTLVVMIGITIAAVHVAGQSRRLAAVVLVLVLTFVYHALLVVILAATTGLSVTATSVPVIVLSAALNTVLAFIVASLVRSYLMRYAPAERTEWLGA